MVVSLYKGKARFITSSYSVVFNYIAILTYLVLLI